MALDTKIIRDQFPLLSRKVHEKPLVYLDNAATTQKPQVVLDALLEYYTLHNANVHRGIHTLGDESTKIYHESRKKIASFLARRLKSLLLFATPQKPPIFWRSFGRIGCKKAMLLSPHFWNTTATLFLGSESPMKRVPSF